MDLKLGVVVFHKNLWKIYKERWFRKSLDTMVNQTVENLHFYEINYGEDRGSFLQGYGVENLKFYHKEMSNYAEAMNFIITEAFNDGCDYVFNTNLDDYYRSDRVERELEFIRSGGYDIVSSDFCYIRENSHDVDEVFHYMNIWRRPEDIPYYLRNNQNIISHPSVCYSKKFWKNNRYDTSKVPQEDLCLWKESIEKGYKFGIHPEILLYYRIHENQVSNK
jgi:hypothetical protein